MKLKLTLKDQNALSDLSAVTVAYMLAFAVIFLVISNISFAQTKTRINNAANWSAASTWIEARTGSALFSNNIATVTVTGTLFLTELQVGAILMWDASPGIISGTVLSFQSNAIANSNTAAYGSQRIFQEFLVKKNLI